MRTKKLIKTFQFVEANRDRITLDAGLRLNADTNRVQLEAGAGGFPLTADLAVRTWVANP